MNQRLAQHMHYTTYCESAVRKNKFGVNRVWWKQILIRNKALSLSFFLEKFKWYKNVSKSNNEIVINQKFHVLGVKIWKIYFHDQMTNIAV